MRKQETVSQDPGGAARVRGEALVSESGVFQIT